MRITESVNFEIIFDIPTPRPHFIVKFKRNVSKTFNDFTDEEIDELLKLIDTFMRENSDELSNENVIFSNHTGNWADKNFFLGHICVSEKSYLKIFEKFPFELNSNHITGKWRLNSNSNEESIRDLYIRNVKNYTNDNLIASNKYRKSELKQIPRLTRTPFEQQNFNESSVWFDLNEPKIFFHAETTKILIREMCNFAQKQQLFDRNKGGSHICVSLTIPNNGYLHLGGDKFYQLHPKAEDFRVNFEKNHNYNITT